MMIEPNLFYEQDGINARGYHDPIGKCFILSIGSNGIASENAKRIFFQVPAILKMYESDIIPHTSSAGDDTHYYLQKDIRCYPTDNYDELSVAASLIAGKLIKGKNVWRNIDGKSVRKLELNASGTPETTTELSEELIKRYDDAADKMFNIAMSNRHRIIDTLSLAYHLKTALGTKNEDRFTVPRQVDHCIATLGVLCEEEEAYDLRIPVFDYTISDKMANDLFHQNTSKKVRTETIKEGLQMSNTRSGQSSDNHQRPQFDALLVMQYIPFLVCGVVPYHKIVTHFKHTDGGWILRRVPTNYFKYVISPTETISARDIPSEFQKEIEDFVFLVQGGFLPKLLDKLPKIDDTPPSKIELW
jgi:hypothetical protein